MNIKSELCWIQFVMGSNRISNWLWACALSICGIGFLLTGLSSYLDSGLFSMFPYQQIMFSPQGLIMCFYGASILFLSVYLWGTIIWKVGSGYNEFDIHNNMVSIFRWGFPGHKRRIRVRCCIQHIQAIQLQANEWLDFRYTILLRLKDQQYLALTQTEELLNWTQIEQTASQLAQFLRIPIETS
jgi:hypothetical protein